MNIKTNKKYNISENTFQKYMNSNLEYNFPLLSVKTLNYKYIL